MQPKLKGQGAFKVLIGKPTGKRGKGKRPQGSPRSRWEENIRVNLKELGVKSRNWID